MSEVSNNAKAPGAAQKLRQLWRQQRRLIMIAIVPAVLAAAVIAVVLTQNRLAADPAATGTGEKQPAYGEEATVLPQIKRNSDTNAALISRDPFAAPPKLTGVVTGGAGGSMAIIESGGVSHIVTMGDVIDELWTVRRISMDEVLLASADREISLRLRHRIAENGDGGEAEEDER